MQVGVSGALLKGTSYMDEDVHNYSPHPHFCLLVGFDTTTMQLLVQLLNQ